MKAKIEFSKKAATKQDREMASWSMAASSNAMYQQRSAAVGVTSGALLAAPPPPAPAPAANGVRFGVQAPYGLGFGAPAPSGAPAPNNFGSGAAAPGAGPAGATLGEQAALWAGSNKMRSKMTASAADCVAKKNKH